jgi:thiosulfate/3-mercaptopyruvate sulfurtransferase
VDCRYDLAVPARGARDHAAGHVPGAVYASLDGDLSAPPDGHNGRHPLPAPAAFAATLARWGVAPGVQVVAYDETTGAYASRLWWMLRNAGHHAAAVLDGGFAKWVREGRAVEVGPGTAARAEVQAAQERRPPGDASFRAVTADEVAARGTDAVLIDARSPERFRGEVEPLDRVPGHVPGAVNRHYMDNLGADGTFRPLAELRRDYEALLAGASPADAIVMCGSGVTACHDLLAMEAAGLRSARLYAGSWSEWCGDRARPVATGEAGGDS